MRRIRGGGSGGGDVHIINCEIHICEKQLPGGNSAPVSSSC